MGKTVAMFPGQGSQYVGMARDLGEGDPPRVHRLYKTANDILGFDIAGLSLSGPEEVLLQTKYTQPAIFIHSCAVYDLAAEEGFIPDYCAGHSVGEYAALYAAGVLTFKDGLRAVGKRAEFMQSACDNKPGTMAAVLGLDYKTVREVCNAVEGIVVPANHNSPEQTAISGERSAVEQAASLLKEKGARRVLPLPVGGAFHSPLMEPAAEQLAKVLNSVAFKPARVPVIPNVTARPSSDPAELKDLLVRQITAPVLWYPSLQWLTQNGVDHFVELGPKKVLRGLAKKSVKGANIIGMENLTSIAAALAAVSD